MKWWYIFILASILVIPVFAQTALEDKYIEEFDKLKVTKPSIYRDGDNLVYNIINPNPDFEYFIRINSLGGKYEYEEIILKDMSGSIPFKYPGTEKIQVHLMQRFAEIETSNLCTKYQYKSSYGDMVCDVSKNLDILFLSPTTKIDPAIDYVPRLQYWTRAASDKIPGASWGALNLINAVGVE